MRRTLPFRYRRKPHRSHHRFVARTFECLGKHAATAEPDVVCGGGWLRRERLSEVGRGAGCSAVVGTPRRFARLFLFVTTTAAAVLAIRTVLFVTILKRQPIWSLSYSFCLMPSLLSVSIKITGILGKLTSRGGGS